MTHFILTLLTSIFLLSNHTVDDDCKCSLKWAWLGIDTEVGLKDAPQGKVIKTIKNNPKKEYAVMFEILENKGDWLKVKMLAPDEPVIGWILSSYTAAHTTNYSGALYQVYQQPTVDSKLSGIIREETKVTILKCCGEWTKIRYTSEGETLEGYIKTNLLCGNFYSTCG
ncbi:SH3 domain-containing protein [Cytophaga aurantiaca]|uniref:SH3 domain-containing protein n=1 Tax=Cytophaga aurantiaca TaxID=29530 RepID=UPI00037CFBD0|nr:SH3 domain-containing protein [Cytophaga aurantiaca]